MNGMGPPWSDAINVGRWRLPHERISTLFFDL
jgi:hypothetical protein